MVKNVVALAIGLIFTQRITAEIVGDTDEYHHIKAKQEFHDSILQNHFIQLMRRRADSLENHPVQSPFLTPFIYRPIFIELSEQIPAQESLYLFTNSRGETYVPLIASNGTIEKRVIDPVPTKKKKHVGKSPAHIRSWLADRRKKTTSTLRTVIYRNQSLDKQSDSIIIGLLPRTDTYADSFFITLLESNTHDNMMIIASEGCRALEYSDKTGRMLTDRITSQLLDVTREYCPSARLIIRNLGDPEDNKLVDTIRNRVERYFLSLPDLPEKIVFRGSLESFNYRYYIAVRHSNVWIKSNTEVTGVIDAWMQLSPKMLPRSLDTIQSISCDGVAFLIRDGKNVLYRSGELFDEPEKWVWAKNMGWLGLPLLSSNILKLPVDSAVQWDVTDASARVNDYEDDLAGNRHPFLPGPDGKPGGIAQIYALGADSQTIYSNDFWVSADWRRIIAGPLEGKIKIRTLSASGSTMFIMTVQGDCYTRYWNYNTDGAGSPTNSYTLDPAKAKASNFITCRLLPCERWWRQPSVMDGTITDRLTILQTPQPGNQARELRIEGIQNGERGFFHKLIYDTTWSFTATGHPLHGNIIHSTDNCDETVQATDATSEPAQRKSYEYGGDSAFAGIGRVTLTDFHFYDSPAFLHLETNGRTIVMPVYKAQISPISSRRNDFFRKPSEPISYKIYMELPERFIQSQDTTIMKMVDRLRARWKNTKGKYFYGRIIANENKALIKPKVANPFYAIIPNAQTIRLQAVTETHLSHNQHAE